MGAASKKLTLVSTTHRATAEAIGRRVLAGLQRAKETRRENIDEEVALRLPIILRRYLHLKTVDHAERLSEWRIAGLISRAITKDGLDLGQRQVQRMIARIPAASENTCYFSSHKP